MKRIVVIGCPGAGKSTLSIALGKKLGLPVVHLDRLHWRDGWVECGRAEFDALLQEALSADEWIIDGNYDRTLDRRIARADTVIYLDFNTLSCLWGALKRVLQNHSMTRPDMGPNCPEHLDMEFVGWIMDFNRKNRKRYLGMLSSLADKRVYILNSHRECRAFLQNIS